MRTFIVAACVFATSVLGAAAQVTVVRTFPGQSGPNPAPNEALSSDMSFAVSPQYLVGFINAGFSVHSKVDGRELQAPQTLDQFWSAAFKNAGGQLANDPYDPRMFYDPLSSRWFATSNTHKRVAAKGEDRHTLDMLIAVSTDDNPMHPWKAVAYEVRNSDIFVDNNKLGIDRHGVYLTSLVDPMHKVIPMVAIPKADLLWKGTAAPSLVHLNAFEVEKALPDPARAPKGARGDEGMIPAFDLNPNKTLGDPMIFINRFQSDWNAESRPEPPRHSRRIARRAP